MPSNLMAHTVENGARLMGPVKRSVTIHGHRTSLSLETEFWEVLQDIAVDKNIPLAQLIIRIDENRTQSLSSAIRVFILQELQRKLKTP